MGIVGASYKKIKIKIVFQMKIIKKEKKKESPKDFREPFNVFHIVAKVFVVVYYDKIISCQLVNSSYPLKCFTVF